MSEQVEKLVPKLRFPRFIKDKAWDSKKLEDLIDTVTPPQKLQTSQYKIAGEYPIFDQSQTYICGWTDNKESLVTNNLPLIIFGDHTCVLKIADKPFAQGADGIKILKTKNEVETQFLYQSLQNKPLIMEEYKRHFSTLKERVVFYPDINTGEQQIIADCLSALDDLITAQNQKIEALKQHKKGLMQQLFPAEGETVPKLRFPEFENDGEWVLEEFSKYIVLYRGSSPRPIQIYLTSDSSGINWIKIGDTKNAKNSVLSEVEERITPEGAKHSRKVNIGELILANSMSYGKTYQLAIEGCIYDGWFVLREYEKYFDKQFLLQLLNSEYMQNQYQRLSAGGIVQNISSDIVYKTVLPNTSINEQQKIANFLASLDDLINTQIQKLESYKTLKKGLMKHLFPAMEDVDND